MFCWNILYTNTPHYCFHLSHAYHDTISGFLDISEKFSGNLQNNLISYVKKRIGSWLTLEKCHSLFSYINQHRNWSMIKKGWRKICNFFQQLEIKGLVSWPIISKKLGPNANAEHDHWSSVVGFTLSKEIHIKNVYFPKHGHQKKCKNVQRPLFTPTVDLSKHVNKTPIHLVTLPFKEVRVTRWGATTVDKKPNIFARLSLKGTVSRDFLLLVFLHESVSPKPLSIPLGPFRIFSKIREDIRS